VASCAVLSLKGLIGTLPILNHQQDAPGRTVRTRKLSQPTMAGMDYGCISIREVYGRILAALFPRRCEEEVRMRRAEPMLSKRGSASK